MVNKERVCLAVLQYTDLRYSCEPIFKSFHVKQAFLDFLADMIDCEGTEEVMVILLGGNHKYITLDAARSMNWVMETA